MADRTKIEWCNVPGFGPATWNPWRGCRECSMGCKNCYARRIDERFGRDFHKIERASEKQFYAPLHWKKPRMVFTCSMGDFFIEEADEWREEAWKIIQDTRHTHTYQVLTKRPERFGGNGYDMSTSYESLTLPSWRLQVDTNWKWPWDNVWLGVSVENQEQADKRIPLLLSVPAEERFLSVEPMLEEIDISTFLRLKEWEGEAAYVIPRPYIGWVVLGGESGPHARPMDLDWARAIRDQCKEVGVPFFMKQIIKGTRKISFDEFPEDLKIREFPNIIRDTLTLRSRTSPQEQE